MGGGATCPSPFFDTLGAKCHLKSVGISVGKNQGGGSPQSKWEGDWNCPRKPFRRFEWAMDEAAGKGKEKHPPCVTCGVAATSLDKGVV